MRGTFVLQALRPPTTCVSAACGALRNWDGPILVAAQETCGGRASRAKRAGEPQVPWKHARSSWTRMLGAWIEQSGWQPETSRYLDCFIERFLKFGSCYSQLILHSSEVHLAIAG